jgi:hypothetical protein
MKKILSILFAMIFVVATTGLCFAQAAPAAPKAQEKAAAPADKAIDKSKADDKAKAPEKKADTKKADKKKTDKKKADTKKADKKEMAPEKAPAPAPEKK